MIHLITGGERSGKSSYAQHLALEASNAPIYLATAKVWDDDFKQRIDRHKTERDERWQLIESEMKLFDPLPENSSAVVIDCITLWLTNFFSHFKSDKEKTLEAAKNEINQLTRYSGNLFIVTNEIGMGVHAHNQAARDFVELQGWTNQYLAKKAIRVILMVSGIPMQVK
ncbi:MAG: bifunctional adenosylcobinamide kinase/adenosylcobinamide-phosphate guanylyltransferase [Bacteroidota bacterium]